MIQNSLEVFKNKLSQKGIRHPDQLEELIDHYQSSLEYKLASGHNYNDALIDTVTELEKANHNDVRKNHKWFLAGLVVLLLVAMLTFIAYANEKPVPTETTTIHKEDTAQQWPVADSAKNVSSTFGPRKHPIYKQIRYHRGIDIKANAGTPVLAWGNGIIMDAGYHAKYGNYIYIEHSNGYSTRYMHLEKSYVNSCDRVTTNMAIGTVGSSGLSVRPHLHFEILVDDKPVDPMDHLQP